MEIYISNISHNVNDSLCRTTTQQHKANKLSKLVTSVTSGDGRTIRERLFYDCLHIQKRMASGLEHWTGDRVVLGSNPASELWQFRLPRFCQCLSEETLKAIGPFYLVIGEVKDPNSLHWTFVTCRGLHHAYRRTTPKRNPVCNTQI